MRKTASSRLLYRSGSKQSIVKSTVDCILVTVGLSNHESPNVSVSEVDEVSDDDNVEDIELDDSGSKTHFEDKIRINRNSPQAYTCTPNLA